MRPMRILFFALLVLCLPLGAAPLPIQAIGNPWQAAARTTTPAYIIVQLSNADGTPKIDAELPVASVANPSAGVEFRGSKWSFETFQIPQGFQANEVTVVPPKTAFEKAAKVAIPMPGQLRVVQIAPAFRPGDATDAHAGVYYFSIMPMFGSAGKEKKQLAWVSGHYIFRVTYRDGADVGTALGELVIP